jgi:hypothetical protein
MQQAITALQASVDHQQHRQHDDEVNTHVKHLQAMLDATIMVDPTLDRDDEAWGQEPDPGRVLMGTQHAVSLHRRNMDKDDTRMTEICTTSFTVEMHTARLKTGAKSMSALNRSSVKKGIMTTTVPIMTNLTDSILPKGGAMLEESRLFPTTSNHRGLRSMMGPPTQPSGSRCISLPSKLLVGTRTSCQTICQSVCRHPPGPGSSGFPWCQFVPRATYASCSPVTSAPCKHIRESTRT